MKLKKYTGIHKKNNKRAYFVFKSIKQCYYYNTNFKNIREIKW